MPFGYRPIDDDLIEKVASQATAAFDRHIAALSRLMLQQRWRINKVLYGQAIWPIEGRSATEALGFCERCIAGARRQIADGRSPPNFYGLLAARDALAEIVAEA